MDNNIKLLNLLNYVKDNVGFYQDKVTDEVSQLNENNIIEVLNKLPIITKYDIKSDYKRFISHEILEQDVDFLLNANFDFKQVYQYNLNPKISILLEFTSGSSGSPLMIMKSIKETLILGRYIWRLRNSISPVKPIELFDFAHSNNQNNGYPFPFKEETDIVKRVEKELEFLRTSNYKWWHMNTYDIEVYYNYIYNHGLYFTKNDKLKVIENNGSYISIEDKKRFEKLFSCKIVDHYGCRETWTIAFDCKFGSLHINEDNIKIELIDSENKIITEVNRVGKIAITSLNQYLMPFIRYRLDDLAYYVEGKCACGSRNKRIILLPGEDRIIGTKLYGHRYFKDIVCYLNSFYKITKFHSISVMQKDTLNFIVNIKNNEENSELIERCFKESSKLFFKRDDYIYTFTYDNELKTKSIFTIA